MTITSVGYDGSVDEVQLASWSTFLGSRYAVYGLGLSIGGAGDRAVTIAPGSAFGTGVLDVSDASILKNAASVSSGSRWDTLVMRRNWATNTTTLVLVNGTTAKAVASGLNATPGTLDDQPLFLIRSQAGQTAVQEVEDLRQEAGRLSFFAGDARPDPNLYRHGEMIVMNDPDAGGAYNLLVRRGTAPNAIWEGATAAPIWTPVTLPGSVVADGTAPAVARIGGIVCFRGAWRKQDGTKFVPGGGTGGVYSLGAVPAGFRPGASVSFGVDHGFDSTSTSARVMVSPAGVVTGQVGPAQDSTTTGATSRIRADGVIYPAEN